MASAQLQEQEPLLEEIETIDCTAASHIPRRQQEHLLPPAEKDQHELLPSWVVQSIIFPGEGVNYPDRFAKVWIPALYALSASIMLAQVKWS